MDKFVKDPAAVLDYTWDWSDFLAVGETITEHAVTADLEDLEIEPISADDTSVTAWVAGGEHEQRALLTCQITTSDGRTDERSIYLLVLDQ